MSAHGRTPTLARNRIRAAVVTVAVLLLTVTALTFQHLEQQHQHKPGVWDYLLDHSLQQPSDPLGIADASSQDTSGEDASIDYVSASDIDTVAVNAGGSTSKSLAVSCSGVSKDNQIVGYLVDASLEKAVCEFDNRVRRLGWLMQSDNKQGLCTYSLCTYENLSSASSQYALVIYCESNNVTSIVVELM